MYVCMYVCVRVRVLMMKYVSLPVLTLSTSRAQYERVQMSKGVEKGIGTE